MLVEDYIVRATAAGGTVRAFAAVTTDIVRTARATHNLSPTASAALGRTLTAAAIMSRTLKGERDTLTIQIKGDGPLGGIVVISDSESNVRGYVYNPQADMPLNSKGKLDVGGIVGREGYLNVIKDLGLKEPYIGYVSLASGEIGDDIAYYFAYSEQVPSLVALGVLVNPDGSIANSGGYIVQLMPGASEETISSLESKVNTLPAVTKLLSSGKTAEDILGMLLNGLEPKIVERTGCRFKCNCSRERMERNILSLGRVEIEDIIHDQHKAELQCHFCNTKYMFSEEELLNLMEPDTR
jgi:molecular chaperone Hsp33